MFLFILFYLNIILIIASFNSAYLSFALSLILLKIILLDHQNNYVGNSSIMSNATKKFWYSQFERPT